MLTPRRALPAAAMSLAAIVSERTPPGAGTHHRGVTLELSAPYQARPVVRATLAADGSWSA
jgi:hypothetical protein